MVSELFKAMKWAAFQSGGGISISEEEAANMAVSLVAPIRPIANIMDKQGKRKNHTKRRPKRRKGGKEKPERDDKK